MPTQSRTLRWATRAGFVLALALTLFFAVRTIGSAIYWNDPQNQDRPPEGWMPLGYVARSWDVPRDMLAHEVGLRPGTEPRRNLDLIARDEGIPLETLIARILTVIDAHRASNPEAPAHD
jgi:hypothetical protein